MSNNNVIFDDDDIEAPGFKYKCSPHEYYTNDRADFQRHLMDPSLTHIEIISNGICFYCHQRLDADMLERVQTRHFMTGKATHKACREKMYEEIVNGTV